MKYAMTVKSNSTIGFWEDCKATTERAAKAEATRRFDAGYLGDSIELAIVHEDGQRQVVANKTIGDNRWHNANA